MQSASCTTWAAANLRFPSGSLRPTTVRPCPSQAPNRNAPSVRCPGVPALPGAGFPAKTYRSFRVAVTVEWPVANAVAPRHVDDAVATDAAASAGTPRPDGRRRSLEATSPREPAALGQRAIDDHRPFDKIMHHDMNHFGRGRTTNRWSSYTSCLFDRSTERRPRARVTDSRPAISIAAPVGLSRSRCSVD